MVGGVSNLLSKIDIRAIALIRIVEHRDEVSLVVSASGVRRRTVVG